MHLQMRRCQNEFAYANVSKCIYECKCVKMHLQMQMCQNAFTNANVSNLQMQMCQNAFTNANVSECIYKCKCVKMHLQMQIMILTYQYYINEFYLVIINNFCRSLAERNKVSYTIIQETTVLLSNFMSSYMTSIPILFPFSLISKLSCFY